eukprot:2021924-Alexandrium_andersonii.AAC.1
MNRAARRPARAEGGIEGPLASAEPMGSLEAAAGRGATAAAAGPAPPRPEGRTAALPAIGPAGARPDAGAG